MFDMLIAPYIEREWLDIQAVNLTLVIRTILVTHSHSKLGVGYWQGNWGKL